MEMVPVVVTMPVFMLHCSMAVLMFMLISDEQHERNSENTSGNEVPDNEGFGQDDRRQSRPKKWGGGKEHLRPSGTELLSCCDVEGDACTVGQRTYQKAPKNQAYVGERRSYCARQHEVERAGSEALPECALGRGDAVNQRRQVVVETPEQARQSDERRCSKTARSLADRDDHACRDNADRPHPAPPAQVVAEDHVAQERRGHEFEVEP